MDKNKIPLNIFLNLSKAFHTLDHAILLDTFFHLWESGKSAKINKQLQKTDNNLLNFEIQHQVYGNYLPAYHRGKF